MQPTITPEGSIMKALHDIKQAPTTKHNHIGDSMAGLKAGKEVLTPTGTMPNLPEFAAPHVIFTPNHLHVGCMTRMFESPSRQSWGQGWPHGWKKSWTPLRWLQHYHPNHLLYYSPSPLLSCWPSNPNPEPGQVPPNMLDQPSEPMPKKEQQSPQPLTQETNWQAVT